MAGVSRLQYSTDMRVIRVMCSGRVDLEFILRAFANGMDGVFVGGCRLGECNYITHGNFHALNTVLLAKRILEYVGLDPGRLRVAFMSSGEGLTFARVVDGFNKSVRELGPLGLGEGQDLLQVKAKIEAVRKLIPYIKIATRQKMTQRVSEDQYDSFFTSQEIDALLNDRFSYHIDPEKCQACGMCFRRCPVGAIEGGKNTIHVIDQDKCIRCGSCLDACPPRFGAVHKIESGPVPPPPPPEQRAVAKKGKEAG